MRIAELAPPEHAAWDRFVQQCPEATFFHRAGWQTVIEQVFRHRSLFLYAEQDGEITGVLPLAQVRSWLFGHSLVSLPFCVYGGAAVADETVREALEQAAVARARELGVDHLELRHREPVHPEWPTKGLYHTFRKAIDPDPDVNLQNIPRKQRRMVRQGIKAGLTAEHDSGVDRFFRTYAASVHRLGTPVFPKALFRTLREVFGADCDVLTVHRDGQVIASVMSFYFRDEVLPYYGGGYPAARDVAGYDFMYWELMRRACESGYRVFDFGRSKEGTGAFSFKKNWGFEPQPLAYEFYLVRGREVPDHNPMNPKYRRFIRLWQRLPLPVANLLGPRIVRGLG